jgi:flavin-dependent dehydrogenase
LESGDARKYLADLDVVILGGGPAGCATALALGNLGISRTLIVEAKRTRGDRIGESIPPHTRTLLNRLGILEAFLRENHEPCLGNCSSWGTETLGFNDALFCPLGNGWHLDRRRFDEFLVRKVAEHGICVRRCTQFAGYEPLNGEGFRLNLVNDRGEPSAVTARFVVDATGARSCFARTAGVRRRFLDQLLCVGAVFTAMDSPYASQLSILEAIEYGWWYLARMSTGLVGVFAASDPKTVRQIGLHIKSSFLEHLAATRHAATLLSGCQLNVDTWFTCAAPSFLLEKVVGNGWLAVGDAASSFDPLSSQGIHKALSDGLGAGEAIAIYLRGSNKAALLDYQTRVNSRFEKFVGQRHYFYGLERRWSASPFWTRQHCSEPHENRYQCGDTRGPPQPGHRA